MLAFVQQHTGYVIFTFLSKTSDFLALTVERSIKQHIDFTDVHGSHSYELFGLSEMTERIMKTPLNILVLEDSHDDFGLITHTLKKDGLSFESICVDSKDEFTNALRTFRPDVVLSDHALPQFNSIEALKICRAEGLNIPFILVTGTVSEEFAVNSLKQGADDYILKSNLARLPSAIVNALKQRELEKRRNLAEQDLRSQNEELVKINRELDSFVYSVSHNIRSPLMSVLGLVNLVQNAGNELDNRDQLFDMMRSSIQKLDDTLREILDYSKNARSEVNVSVVDIKSILLECFDNLRYMPGSAEIEKKISISGPVSFYSDAYRLHVIFNNLISNSIKYRDYKKTHPSISINVEVLEEFASILFEDNGIGISSELMNKIFQMFFRATDKSEGSGLGLYIVKEAVEKMKGEIKVSSVLGSGTVFSVRLPNYKPVHQAAVTAEVNP